MKDATVDLKTGTIVAPCGTRMPFHIMMSGQFLRYQRVNVQMPNGLIEVTDEAGNRRVFDGIDIALDWASMPPQERHAKAWDYTSKADRQRPPERA